MEERETEEDMEEVGREEKHGDWSLQGRFT